MLLFVPFFAFLQAPSPSSLPELLSRTAEEAEIFQQNAPKSLTQETLEQRTMVSSTRFRPHLGTSKSKVPADFPKPHLVTHEIVSEYSVSTLQESPDHNLTEFRQVISVDGRKIQSAEKARHSLTLGLKSPDDRARKRMLEDFAKHGLVDIATDYGLILLAFNKRGQQNMKFSLAGEEQVGADSAWVLAWRQLSSAGGMLEFAGNQTARRALEGRLFVRKSDGLPLRVQAWTEHPQEGRMIRDEATVEYIVSTHGFLTPASVVHRHIVDNALITENLYRYDPFKLFSADTEIKFTELPDTLPPPPPPTKK